MLDLVFGLMLATSGLTDPGLDNSGLDRRRPETTQSVELAAPLPPAAAGTDDPALSDAPGADTAEVLGGPLNR